VLDELLSAAAADQHGAGEWELMLGALAEHSNIRQLPLKTLLVQLELRGIIAPRYAYFAEYRFKYLCEPEALLARFAGERRQFVEAVIGTSSRARTWCTVDFDRLYQQHQAERGRVVKALDYFQEQGWIELESKQMTEVYALRDAGFDPEALSAELHGYFKQQERSEIARIHAMLELFASEQCLSQRLASYFGDAQAPQRCGHCSVCHGRVAHLPQPAPLPGLADQDLHALCRRFIDRHAELKGVTPSAECLTRFLCGISVPLFTKLKARSIQGFAALERYPYAAVREWCAARLQGGL
jgi:ATP-dependent DNA helicase RecQ